eukprot:scaffold15503_cov114-Isochrysis_galbana.AAC.3
MPAQGNRKRQSSCAWAAAAHLSSQVDPPSYFSDTGDAHLPAYGTDMFSCSAVTPLASCSLAYSARDAPHKCQRQTVQALEALHTLALTQTSLSRDGGGWRSRHGCPGRSRA